MCISFSACAFIGFCLRVHVYAYILFTLSIAQTGAACVVFHGLRLFTGALGFLKAENEFKIVVSCSVLPVFQGNDKALEIHV